MGSVPPAGCTSLAVVGFGVHLAGQAGPGLLLPLEGRARILRTHPEISESGSMRLSRSRIPVA
jgi:hypothetical protein